MRRTRECRIRRMPKAGGKTARYLECQRKNRNWLSNHGKASIVVAKQMTKSTKRKRAYPRARPCKKGSNKRSTTRSKTCWPRRPDATNTRSNGTAVAGRNGQRVPLAPLAVRPSSSAFPVAACRASPPPLPILSAAPSAKAGGAAGWSTASSWRERVDATHGQTTLR